jgi:hypothetical protein
MAKVLNIFARHHCGIVISTLSRKHVSRTLDLISQGSTSISVNDISRCYSMPCTSPVWSIAPRYTSKSIARQMTFTIQCCNVFQLNYCTEHFTTYETLQQIIKDLRSFDQPCQYRKAPDSVTIELI